MKQCPWYLGYRPTPTSCISPLLMVKQLQVTWKNKGKNPGLPDSLGNPILKWKNFQNKMKGQLVIGWETSPTLALFHLGVITSGTHSPVKLQSIKSRNNSILQKCGVKHMQRPYFPVQREKKYLTQRLRSSAQRLRSRWQWQQMKRSGCFHADVLLMPGCHRHYNECYWSPTNIAGSVLK